MINFKQQELAQNMFNQIKGRYPEVEFVNIAESGVYPDHLWIRLVLPKDEERRWEVREFAAELSIDTLTTYGHHITIHSVAKPERSAVSLATA
jgi:hypothetical protein